MPSYQSFSGSDIVATFGGRTIGELLAINWSVTREKAPNYTMGFKNPRGFARGRRGISGSLQFAVFNRNALLDEMRKRDKGRSMEDKVAKFGTYAYTNSETGERTYIESGANGEDLWQPEQFDETMSRVASANNGDLLEAAEFNTGVEYADQIQPFDITISFLNEANNKAKVNLVDVELLNQGMGVSIDDLATSQSYTFVCRDIHELTPVDEAGNSEDYRNPGDIGGGVSGRA